jgi:hypothetical protein
MTQVNTNLLQQVVNRSMELLLTGSKMLDAIERAMDDLDWPEDDETELDDIVVHIELRLKERKQEKRQQAPKRAAKPAPPMKKKYTAEQMEERELRKAEKMLDKKAADMMNSLQDLTLCEGDDEDNDWCDADVGNSNDWMRVLNVIDLLDERYKESKCT